MAPGHGFSSAVGDNESRTDEDTRTGRTMRGFPTGIRVGESGFCTVTPCERSEPSDYVNKVFVVKNFKIKFETEYLTL